MNYNFCGVDLIETCGACPEAYDAYIDGCYVGYLRLRHGYFIAEYMDTKTVFEAKPFGDGIFDYDERDIYLEAACKSLVKEHSSVQEDV